MSGNVVQFTSRQFLVGQAVLNAAQENFPWCVKKHGVAHVLRRLADGDPDSLRHFHFEVVAEFQKLTGCYQEAPGDDGELSEAETAVLSELGRMFL